MPVLVLLGVFPLDPLSGLVLLLTAPIIPLFMVLIGSQAKEMTQRRWTELSRLSAHFLDVLQGLTTLKLFGHSRDQAASIAQISERFGRTTMQVLRVAFLSSLILELTATLSTAVVAVEIGLRLLNGGLPFEQALTVLLLAPEFYLPLRLLGARYHAGMAGTEAVQRISAILDTPTPGTRAPAAAASAWAMPSGIDIEFDEMGHAYDGGERPALTNVSLRIPAGQTVALVGPSGAGKTTIARLLLRFSEPDHGAITVAGTPLGAPDLSAWRAQIAWVPQNPYLFHGSVAENIRLARPDAGQEEIVAAARAAQAHEFIAALPRGYDTPVGEHGARVSGGERQRLALARAFLKDAPLVILDEATAHLDALSEQAVLQALDRLTAGRTTLTITHRLIGCEQAGQILVMQAGRIVERGTHRELLQAGGLYRRLWERQRHQAPVDTSPLAAEAVAAPGH